MLNSLIILACKKNYNDLVCITVLINYRKYNIYIYLYRKKEMIINDYRM